MFCDLVDSIGLSSRLDPEDLRDVIAAYQRACVRPIERYNGHVARYVGDGILAFFGYPVAHEDDAERAVLAGLELLEAVGKISESVGALEDVDLKVRVGIATGLVVVGDVIAEGVSERDAVAGEAANLASRLQGLAGPNSIVVSSVTRQLAAERFEYRDLGIRNLKGFDRPVCAYQVVAERTVSRLEARSVALTPFVARDKEIEILLRCWESATSGHGQVAIISGDAGIGKSRISAEACARISGMSRECQEGTSNPLIFQCSPFHANAPLYPIIRQLERLAEVRPSDSNREKFDKLEALVGDRHPEHRQTLSLLADLLGVAPNGRCPPLDVGATVKRHLTIEALRDWCASRSRDGTLVIVFEDVQWIDPTSKLLLNRLADWARKARVLIMITMRTDEGTSAESLLGEAGFVPAGTRLPPHVTVCEIEELGDAEMKQLMAVVAQSRTFSPAQIDAVLTKSEGNPLYVEELTKVLLNVMDYAHAQVANERIGSLAVPNTISDALMARLDQLGRAKEVAQRASVIGHEFSLRLLAKIADKSLDEMLPDLNRLLDSRLVVPSTADSDLYQFKHALIRDISYQSLLRKSRREVHLSIARELAERAAEAADATDDLIAQHFSLGGAYTEAIGFWQTGAKNAIGRSAHEEALGMLESALADLRKLRSSASVVQELDLVLAQATALRSIRGYSALEVEERLVRARDLCTRCEDRSNRFNVEWGLFQCTIVKDDVDHARQLAAGLFEHAERHPDRPFVDAHLANGMVAFHLGDLEGAKIFLEKGVNLSRLETDEPHFFTHGQNPGLFCLSYLARTQCLLGYIDRARACIGRSLVIAAARARKPGHIYSYVNALIHAVRVYHLCGDFESARRLANESFETSRRNHYAYYQAMSECYLGWILGADGSLSEGIDKMVGGIAALEQTGTSLALPGLYALLSQLYIRAREFDSASRVLERVIGPKGFDSRVWDADIERVRGDIFAMRPHPDFESAEVAYRSGLAIARRQKAGLLILKVGLSLGQLLRRLDRPREGHELLKRCFEQLHEGFETGDARLAQTIMKDLAASEFCNSKEGSPLH